MAINILVFETKQAEKEYFDNNNFEDCDITCFEECLNEEFTETLSDEILDNTNAISIFNNSSITGEVLNKFKNLRAISIRSSYFDHICINSCVEKNIAVVNIPHFGAQSVAEFTMGLIINLVRNIVSANDFIKSDKKYYGGFLGRDLDNLTLGVIGTGLTGGMVCKFAHLFDMKIIAHDTIPRQELIEKYNVEYLPLDELAEKSDIITIHLDYLPETYHLINEEFLAKCKDGIYFINTSKSEIIDLNAFCKYLENGKIKGAALDTSPCESICYNCKNLSEKLSPEHLECLEQTTFINKFKDFNNVIITPCISYATQDAIENNLYKTIINIKKVLRGDRMCRVV